MENTRSDQFKTSKLRIFTDSDQFNNLQYIKSVSAADADVIVQNIGDKKLRLTFTHDNKRKIVQKSNLEFHLQVYEKLLTQERKSWFDLISNKNVMKSNSLSLLNSLKDCHDLKGFLSQQMERPSLKMVSHLYLITHKKGELNAFNYSIIGNQHQSSKISVEEYNELFNSIRKSKQSTFAESFLKSNQINIVGTCLAKAGSYKSYNFILVGTRNEFIPFTSSEIEEFNIFCQISLPLFDLILQTKTESQLMRNLKEINHKIEEGHLNLKRIHSEYHLQRVSLLGELLNTLRHELSNPLFGIQLSTSLLVEELQSEDKELADQIQEAVNKSLRILNGFSKLYGPLDELQHVSLINLINEVFTLTKSETKMLERTIEISSNLEQENSSVKIVTNPTSLSQIFFNLIINSSQAMHEQKDPRPKIEIKIERELTNLRISFRDNGPGIPIPKQDQIFDSFYTTKETGTGLGLAICRNLIRKLGGDLWCVKNDKGAQFDLVLPYESPTS